MIFDLLKNPLIIGLAFFIIAVIILFLTDIKILTRGKSILRQSGIAGKAVGISSEEKKADDIFIKACEQKRIGDYKKAEALFDNAAQIYAKLEVIDKEGVTYIHLGEVYSLQNKEFEAQDAFKYAEILLSECKKESSFPYLSRLWGEHNFRHGDFEKAREKITAAINLSQIHKDDENLALSYKVMGDICYKLKEEKEVREKYLLAVPLLRKIEMKKELGLVLYSLGILEFGAKRYDESKKNIEEAAPLFLQLKKPGEAAKCYYILGILLSFQKEYTDAISNFEQSLHAYETVNDAEGKEKNILKISEMYTLKGQFDVALKNYNIALELTNASKNFNHLFACYLGIARIELKTSYLSRSIKMANNAIGIWQKTDVGFKGLSELYYILGSCNLHQGNINAARQNIKDGNQALNQETDGDTSYYAGLLIFVDGRCDLVDANTEQGIEKLLAAEKLFIKSNHKDYQAQVLLCLAREKLHTKNYNKAKEYITNAIRNLDDLKLQYEMGYALCVSVLILIAKNELLDAGEKMNKAKGIFASIGSKIGDSFGKYIEANLALKLGEKERALSLIKHAEAQYSKSEYKTGLGFIYYTFGKIYIAMQDFGHALDYYTKAQEIFISANNKVGEYQILLAKIKMYKILDNQTDAKKTLQILLQRTEKNPSNYFHAYALSLSGDLANNVNKLAIYTKSLNAYQKLTHISGQAHVMFKMAKALHKMGNFSEGIKKLDELSNFLDSETIDFKALQANIEHEKASLLVGRNADRKDIDQAEILNNEAIQYASSNGDVYLLAHTASLAGRIHSLNERPYDAVTSYKVAVDNFSKIGFALDVNINRLRLADSYHDNGDFADAVKEYQVAIQSISSLNLSNLQSEKDRASARIADIEQKQLSVNDRLAHAV